MPEIEVTQVRNAIASRGECTAKEQRDKAHPPTGVYQACTTVGPFGATYCTVSNREDVLCISIR